MDETMHDYTFEEDLQAKLEAIHKFIDALHEALEPTIEAVRKFIKVFIKVMDKLTYRWYKSEGAIYDKTKKGRDRWLSEMQLNGHVLQE